MRIRLSEEEEGGDKAYESIYVSKYKVATISPYAKVLDGAAA